MAGSVASPQINRCLPTSQRSPGRVHGFDHRRHRPGGQELLDLALQTLEPRLGVLDRVDVVLEHDLLGGAVEADRGQPAAVRLVPAPHAAVAPAVAPQEKALQVLARLAEHAACRGPRPVGRSDGGSGPDPRLDRPTVAHRLVGGIRHPHRHQLPRPVQLGQRGGIAAIGPHPVTGLARAADARRSRTVQLRSRS